MSHSNETMDLTPDEVSICALSSGKNEAAISLIRISGMDCHKICLPLFKLNQDQNQLKYWKLYKTPIIDASNNSKPEIIDDILLSFFKGPKSFTGQDMLEISCHGGPYIVSRILKLLHKNGIRLAEPGEFTKRGFLNGKFDLTEAEGIKELVRATSHQQWLAANQLAQGRLKNTIDSTRSMLIEAMAYLEAMIDFPDEDDTKDVALNTVYQKVDRVKIKLLELKNSYDSGRVAKEGLKVVIVGYPNQGKSTLLNYFIAKERAIVSSVPGTTRDYIEESCLINGRLIRLFDTAGIRNTPDIIEQKGVEISLNLIKEADLVLFLLATDESSENIKSFKKEFISWRPKDYLLIRTKSDLGEASWNSEKCIPVSCKNDEGLKKLYEEISLKVDSTISEIGEKDFICTERHKIAIDESLNFLDNFYRATKEGLYEECLAFELQQVAKSLHSIIGVMDHEDILDKVFGDFCIGK